jgi:hypothetical protein
MTYNEETRILRADDGKWITNGDTYAIEAKLAPSDDVTNWREVDKIPEPENPELADEYINTEPEE